MKEINLTRDDERTLHAYDTRVADQDRPREALDRLIERVTRILSQHKCARYFTYEAAPGRLSFRLDREQYRQQRQHDRVFVLETNHPTLTTAEIVQSYRQLMEVERAFRLLKSLVKVRPVYHYRDRRVETHIFICFLAYLLGKVLELRLGAAGSNWRPRGGSTGTDVYTAPLVTCRQRSSRPLTMPTTRPSTRRDSKPASLQETQGDS